VRTMADLRRFTSSLLLALVLSLQLAPAAHGASPTIDPPRLSAAGRQTATVPGSYVQPPAKAELMYDGTVRGNGAGARVEVSRGTVP